MRDERLEILWAERTSWTQERLNELADQIVAVEKCLNEHREISEGLLKAVTLLDARVDEIVRRLAAHLNR